MEGNRRDQYLPRGNAAWTSQQSGGIFGSQHPPRGNAASTSQQSRGRFSTTGGTHSGLGSGFAGGPFDDSEGFSTNNNTLNNTGRGTFGNTGQISTPFGQTQQLPAQRNPLGGFEGRNQYQTSYPFGQTHQQQSAQRNPLGGYEGRNQYQNSYPFRQTQQQSAQRNPLGGFGPRDLNQTNSPFGHNQQPPAQQNPFGGSPRNASRQQDEDDGSPGQRGPKRRKVNSRSQRVSDEHDGEVAEELAGELYRLRRSRPRRAGFEAQNQEQTITQSSAAPRARNQGDRLSSGHLVRSAAPPHNINHGGLLAQMPTVQLLDILQKREELLEHTDKARAVVLAKIGELAHELGRRGAGPANMWAPPSIPPAQGTMPAPTSGGNTGVRRRPLRTPYCGIHVPVPDTPRYRVPRANNHDQTGYKFRCIICNEAFRDKRRVMTHFPGCVERNGNVNGACWYDHASIDEDNLPDGLLEE